jgi:hypothetical protein
MSKVGLGIWFQGKRWAQEGYFEGTINSIRFCKPRKKLGTQHAFKSTAFINSEHQS